MPATSTTSPAPAPATARADRRAAIELDREIVAAGGANAVDDRRGDRGGILAARIVVGDDDAIGELGRDAPHLRPLAGIALAAAAEHADERAALGHGGPQRGQHLVERVGRVRVIDHDQRLAVAAQALHPSRRRRDARERRERRVEIDAAREQHAQHAQHVRRVERARQAGRDVAAPQGVAIESSRPACVVATRVAAMSAAVEAVGQHLLSAGPRRVGERAAERIVGVDHAGLERRPGEEAGLGRGVRRHRPVIVEMIAREVREQRDVELDRVDAPLLEAVRRDFHRDGRGARRRAAGRASRGPPPRRASCAPTDRARRRTRCRACRGLPLFRPQASRHCAIQCVHDVLPFVPVTPTTKSARDGLP